MLPDCGGGSAPEPYAAMDDVLWLVQQENRNGLFRCRTRWKVENIYQSSRHIRARSSLFIRVVYAVSRRL
jgi:hypothetical protein